MRAFLLAALAIKLMGLPALAQSPPAAKEEPVQGPEQSVSSSAPLAQSAPSRFAAALSYQLQRSNAPPALCGCFELQGLRAEFAYHPAKLPARTPAVLRHFSGVFELGGGHASNINGNGLDLSLITYMAGPRYSRKIGQRLTPFAQVLIGGVHAFDSVFPRTSGVSFSDNSFALSAGGGVDLNVSARFSVRLVQIDYLKTSLPNDAGNNQNNLRLGLGVVFHTGPPEAVPQKQGRSFFGHLTAFLRHPFRHRG